MYVLIESSEISMENKSRLFIIPVEMENREPIDIARDAADKIGLLMDLLVKSLKHSINGPPERRVKQTDYHKDGHAR